MGDKQIKKILKSFPEDHHDELVALIDIGSGSQKHRVTLLSPSLPDPVWEQKIPFNLNRLFSLAQPQKDRDWKESAQGLADFIILSHALKVKILDIVATAAMRDAAPDLQNAYIQTIKDLVAEHDPDIDFTIHILSGAEEAEYSARGAVHSLIAVGHEIEHWLQMDIGGRSFELAHGHHTKIEDKDSLLAGRNYLAAVSQNNVEKAYQIAQDAFRSAVLFDHLRALDEDYDLIMAGGAGRDLGRSYKKNVLGEKPKSMHGTKIPFADMHDFLKDVLAMKEKDFQNKMVIDPARLENIRYALWAIQGFFDFLESENMAPRDIYLSRYALREGRRVFHRKH